MKLKSGAVDHKTKMLMFGFLPIEWIIKFFGIYYLTITVIVIIPSIFGSELGLRRFYIHLLMKVFKVSLYCLIYLMSWFILK